MIQLKKSCIDAIQRVLGNLNHILHQNPTKYLNQRLNSIHNDIQLIQDNLSLVMTKFNRLQSKYTQKQHLTQKQEQRYHHRYDELTELHKLLEMRYEKLSKELNFIRFNNNNLRKEIKVLQEKQARNQLMRTQIRQIERLLANNSDHLRTKINKIVLFIQQLQNNQNPTHEKEYCFLPPENNQPNTHKQMIFDIHNWNATPTNPTQDNPQNPPTKIPLNNIPQNRLYLSTSKKLSQSKQNSQSFSTGRKKRNELARLVEQQGRLARINQRYLSTNLF